MLRISRENAIKLIGDIRKVSETDIDLKKYFDVTFFENNMEQTELDIEVQGISNGFLSEILCMITGQNIEIYGDVERVFPCPCCGLRT